MSEKLKKQGWIKRTTIGEPTLSEIVEEYHSLGFDVHLEPITLEELNEQCNICCQNQIGKLKTVYIKKRK
ncbi:hypothetical protein KJN74_05050 [Candidatus Bathyarchaeota archaeon]|nr:hypothetical protein [Candidatus Bathyarchaeota archaeon]